MTAPLTLETAERDKWWEATIALLGRGLNKPSWADAAVLAYRARCAPSECTCLDTGAYHDDPPRCPVPGHGSAPEPSDAELRMLLEFRRVAGCDTAGLDDVTAWLVHRPTPSSGPELGAHDRAMAEAGERLAEQLGRAEDVRGEDGGPRVDVEALRGLLEDSRGRWCHGVGAASDNGASVELCKLRRAFDVALGDTPSSPAPSTSSDAPPPGNWVDVGDGVGKLWVLDAPSSPTAEPANEDDLWRECSDEDIDAMFPQAGMSDKKADARQNRSDQTRKQESQLSSAPSGGAPTGPGWWKFKHGERYLGVSVYEFHRELQAELAEECDDRDSIQARLDTLTRAVEAAAASMDKEAETSFSRDPARLYQEGVRDSAKALRKALRKVIAAAAKGTD